jgi:hypothetical protein
MCRVRIIIWTFVTGSLVHIRQEEKIAAKNRLYERAYREAHQILPSRQRE